MEFVNTCEFHRYNKMGHNFQSDYFRKVVISKRVTVVSYGAFSHDVMLFQNNEAAAMLVFQANCTGV